MKYQELEQSSLILYCTVPCTVNLDICNICVILYIMYSVTGFFHMVH